MSKCCGPWINGSKLTEMTWKNHVLSQCRISERKLDRHLLDPVLGPRKNELSIWVSSGFSMLDTGVGYPCYSANWIRAIRSASQPKCAARVRRMVAYRYDTAEVMMNDCFTSCDAVHSRNVRNAARTPPGPESVGKLDAVWTLNHKSATRGQL
jgi:hypothetical protein